MIVKMIMKMLRPLLTAAVLKRLLILGARTYAERTDTPVDDKVVQIIEDALNGKL